MLVPYDRRQPYCSGLAVRPSIVAAESKVLIIVLHTGPYAELNVGRFFSRKSGPF